MGVSTYFISGPYLNHGNHGIIVQFAGFATVLGQMNCCLRRQQEPASCLRSHEWTSSLRNCIDILCKGEQVVVDCQEVSISEGLNGVVATVRRELQGVIFAGITVVSVFIEF
jgi:hypothetical protein